jgi:hypothetical protein
MQRGSTTTTVVDRTRKIRFATVSSTHLALTHTDFNKRSGKAAVGTIKLASSLNFPFKRTPRPEPAPPPMAGHFSCSFVVKTFAAGVEGVCVAFHLSTLLEHRDGFRRCLL